MQEVMNILLSGTGGQGIVLASRIIALCAFKSGFEVKQSEIHGMAQRGGSVIGQIRFGKRVYSPIISLGTADLMLALEELEALRYLYYVKEKGIIILNEKKILPAGLDPTQYPEDILERIKSKGYRVITIKAGEVAKDLGSSKVENTVLLGVLSLFLPFERRTWEETLKETLPEKFYELNLKAFEEGVRLGEKILQSEN
ncbi:MAG: indolepyruvate oxidoreductase subunit beta [Caldimicrobium sp.]|jgi:indolepyruvate ferredoxin oxidoreductase beta subunit